MLSSVPDEWKLKKKQTKNTFKELNFKSNKIKQLRCLREYGWQCGFT